MSAIESSIIILTRNGEATIGECLGQIYTQNYTDFEVIVIDSASTDRTLDILSNFPVKVFNIKVEEFGHGKTRNYGAKLAKGKYLVYLTQDAIPFNENWLENLLQNFNDKDVAGAYSRNVPKEGCDPFEARYITRGWGTEKQLKSIKDPASNYPASYKELVFFSNTSSCIRKDVWEKIPFDDNLVQTEDQDWARNVLEAGYKISYDPASMVLHSHNNSLKTLFRKYFDAGTAHKIVFKNNNNVYFPLIPFFSVISTFLDFKFMLSHGYGSLSIIKWLPAAVLRHFIEATGFWLGLHFNILPLYLKRKFTISGRY
jgi:rhamnosyltransferase